MFQHYNINSSKKHAMSQQAMKKQDTSQLILPDPLPIPWFSGGAGLFTIGCVGVVCCAVEGMDVVCCEVEGVDVVCCAVEGVDVVCCAVEGVDVVCCEVEGVAVVIMGDSVTSHTVSFGPPQSCARS